MHDVFGLTNYDKISHKCLAGQNDEVMMFFTQKVKGQLQCDIIMSWNFLLIWTSRYLYEPTLFTSLPWMTTRTGDLLFLW